MLALLLAPVYILVNVFTAYWLLRWMGAVHKIFTHPVIFTVILAGYLFFALSVLTSFLIRRDPLHRFLKVISNYWLGTYLYFLGFTAIMVGIHQLLLLTPLHGTGLYSARGLAVVGMVSAVLILGVTLYGVYHAGKIRVTRYQVEIGKEIRRSEEDEAGLRIALVADLHLGYSIGKAQMKRMAEQINREQPDLIVMAGDIFDNEFDAIREPEQVARILSGLRSRYGTYACWGNHDLDEEILAGFTFSSGRDRVPDERFLAFLQEAGIRMLNDETVCIEDSFYLIGRKDPERIRKTGETRKSPEELTKELDRTLPVIVIDHQPKELGELAQAGVDLDLGGHTHAGQMFPGTIVTGRLWENSCGMIRKGDMYSIVTSGIGLWGPCMRIGTDSEIVIIDVRTKEQ